MTDDRREREDPTKEANGEASTDAPAAGGEAVVSGNLPAVGSTPAPAATPAPGGATSDGLSPGRLAWQRLRRNRTALVGAIVLVFLYATTIFGSFIQPNDPGEINLAYPSHPPMLPRFVDETGKFHPRPFVYGMELVDVERQSYAYDLSKKYPVKFLVRGPKYKMWWLFETDLHLFGVDPPGKIYLFGADAQGADVFSRVIEGGKVSLSIGIIGITISLLIGMFMGAVAGYFAGWADRLIMRLVEFLLAVPTLYMIIALRGYFQTEGLFGIGGQNISSAQMYFIIVVILALVGWAGQARVIRGMVLSIKEQDFIQAERALGASTFRILSRHILPNTMSYVIISATIAVPSYILGEVALSFLAVGIQPPQVSWGLMLQAGQGIAQMEKTPWLLIVPAAAIFLTVFAFNFVGDGLRDALDPKHTR